MLPVSTDSMTLLELLNTLDSIDRGDTEVCVDTQVALNKSLLQKVDAIKYRLDEWVDEADRHARYAKEHLEKKRTILNQVDRLIERVTYAMRANHFDKLPGEEWSVFVRRSESVETTIDEPTEEHVRIYPHLTNTWHAWKKIELKEFIKAGFTLPFATIKENFTTNFKLNSERKTS